MADTAVKLRVSEKIGYGFGDAAANLVFQTMVIVQLSFYTDTFGISAAAAGTLFLVVRIFDAIFDPLMGVAADRTVTRWGKFRPWILWTAVPFGLMAYLAFRTPNFSPDGKLIYAYVTYIGLMLIYSANNIPYSALSGVVTGDLGERTSLSSYRFVLAMLAQFVIQVFALPMVHYFGGGDSALGYQITMGIFATMCVILFIFCFAMTKERILPDPGHKSSIKQDFLDLTHNGPWITLFVATIFVFITLSLRGGVILYYFKYFVKREDLFSWFNGFALAASICGIGFSKASAMRWGKRNVFMWGLGITTVLTAVFMFIPADAIPVMFAVEILRNFAYGFTIPLLWAMMADVADYGEWRTGRRATAIVFSAIVFGLKAGLGIGGAIGGWLLSSYGYVPNAAQTPEALRGIQLTASLYPSIPFAIGVLCLFLYKIDKKLNVQITDELTERRKKYAISPATL